MLLNLMEFSYLLKKKKIHLITFKETHVYKGTQKIKTYQIRDREYIQFFIVVKWVKLTWNE